MPRPKKGSKKFEKFSRGDTILRSKPREDKERKEQKEHKEHKERKERKENKERKERKTSNVSNISKKGSTNKRNGGCTSSRGRK